MFNPLRQWLYPVLKVNLTFDLSSKAAHFGLPHVYLNIFFSEWTGLIELQFHMEYSLDMTFVSGQLTKIATMPIKYSSLEPKGQCHWVLIYRFRSLCLCMYMYHCTCGPYKIYSHDKPMLTFT